MKRSVRSTRADYGYCVGGDLCEECQAFNAQLRTFAEWEASVARCAKHYDPSADVVLKDALGIAGEAGEIVELIKKDRFQGQPLDREKLRNELGDLFWYLTSMARNNGLTLTEIATANDEKLRRRYPKGFVPGGGVR